MMAAHRTLSKKNRYYLPKEVYLTVIHFCRQYPLWVAELEIDPDTSKAITYDKERVQTSNQYDATAEIAMHRAELARKKKLIDATLTEVSPELSPWLKLGICYGKAFSEFGAVPFERMMYYRARRRFYYEISKHL